jgi:serine/threonine-protein kinase
MYRPTWITIAAGAFTMGSDPRDAAPPFANERPMQRLDLPEFRISRVPITNAQYHRFITATNYPPPGHWRIGEPPTGSEQYPVTYVTWHDAQAFCTWAKVRLPSEAEWEKAARGPSTSPGKLPAETRWWPWGNELPTSAHCHFNGQAQGIAPAAQSVMPVGQFPQGATPYGVLDMAGNVWEWTASPYHPYPFRTTDRTLMPTAKTRALSDQRVVRGGSYNHDLRQIRCAARDGMVAGVRDVYIGFRVADAPGTTSALDLDWVTIPAGLFWMGSDPSLRHSVVLPSEMPQHTLDLAEFRIAQTPVTNAEYYLFVQATGHPSPPHWPADNPPHAQETHPVTHVDWHDVQAFCAWAGVRLPTEAEWERAAAGPSGDSGARIYPWGNEQPDTTRLNFRRKGKQSGTAPVDRYPRGATPDGVLDMAGNVWEWVNTRYEPYPYHAGDGREEMTVPAARVLRGGSFLSPSAAYVRCAMRSLSHESRRREHIGFRVAQR